jgi:hypothetical protein
VTDDHEVIVRRRAHPLAEPKPLPKRLGRWPSEAVVVHGTFDSDGELRAGVVLETVGTSVMSETLIDPGGCHSAEVRFCAATNRPRVIAGARKEIGVISVVELGRLLRDRGYRKGHAVVGAHLAVFLTATAECWPEGKELGSWSLGLPGLGHWIGKRWVKFPDAPRVIVTPLGDAELIGWGTTKKEEVDEDAPPLRPPPRPGPFVDVLTLAAALGGLDRRPDLTGACGLVGVRAPHMGMGTLDRLRAEAHAIAAAYATEIVMVRHLGLRIDPSTLVSTGGIASAMLGEAGIRPVRETVHLPARVAGAAASAFLGGLASVRITHVPIPSVMADINASFPRAASAARIERFFTARHVRILDDTAAMRTLLPRLARRIRRLDRASLRRVAPVLVRVVPDHHLLPAKAVRGGEARLALAPTTILQGGWWWAADVLEGALLDGGRVPQIIEAVRLVPVGTQPGLRPIGIDLGNGLVGTRDDAALGMVMARARIDDDPDLPAWRKDQLAGMLKLAANSMWFGNLARIDRERSRKLVTDEVLDDDGNRLLIRSRVRERPGPWSSLTLAGMVTAIARLVVAHTIASLETAGGTWLALNNDSLVIAATHAAEPQLIPCPGGPIRVGRRWYVRALPLTTIGEILDQTDALLCPEGGRAWKREAGWEEPTVAVVSGVYQVVILDLDGNLVKATEPMLGGVYADPTGTGQRTHDGHFRWALDTHAAVGRATVAWDGKGPVPEVELPPCGDRALLRPGVASHPDQLRRLQRAFPERRLRPFTPFFQAVLDPLRLPPRWRGVVPVTLDVQLPPERWLEAVWRDQRSGERLALTTDTSGTAGALVVWTVRRFVSQVWRRPRDVTTRSVASDGSFLEPGIREPVPVRSRGDLVQLVGKEGDDLLSLMVDPGHTKGDDLTVYSHPDTWAPILDRARLLGPTRLRELTGLSRTTVYRLLAGGSPSPETAALVAAAVAYAEPAPRRMCARPGCPHPAAGRSPWCRTACRKAAQRARDRLALREMGQVRCRRCGTVRVGGGAGCPNCGGRVLREIRGVVCEGCGVERLGDTSGPCAVCAQGASA